MNNELLNHFSKYLKGTIQNVNPVSGGDISNSYRIQTTEGWYFIKCNEAVNALTMFETEANGLERIKKTESVFTPKIIEFGCFNNVAFLILESIESKSPSNGDLNKLGEKLAQLHLNSSNSFGLEHDNFIGKLTQSNTWHKNWQDFYIHERLSPQYKLALHNGLLNRNEMPSHSEMNKTLENMFRDIRPSLLHGDLWSGNYIIAKDGNAYIIDPAIYYGHSEVDIAMSKLFGGFGDAFYDAYFSIIPKDHYTDSRIEIYQLYYLLVHLNMFGKSYYGSVKRIMKKYFSDC